MRKNLFFALSLMISISIILGIAFYISKSHKAQAQTGTPLSACGTISATGQYYLSQDVTAIGTCFSITANNVIFDLNNHTIIYGTGGTVAYGINSTGGNVEIKATNGGNINQHSSAASYSHGVYQPYFASSYLGEGIKVHGLTITTTGAASVGIKIKGVRKGTYIYDNNVTTAILNTGIGAEQQSVGVAVYWNNSQTPATETDRATIHDNTLFSVQGVYLGETSFVDVYNNQLTSNSPPTNQKHSKAIAMWNAENCRFWNNTITSTSGGGILVDGGSTDNSFNDNNISINDNLANENLDGIYVRFGSSRNTFTNINVTMNSTAMEGTGNRFNCLYIAGEAVAGGGDITDNVFQNSSFNMLFAGSPGGYGRSAIRLYTAYSASGEGAYRNTIKNSIIKSNTSIFDISDSTKTGEQHNLVKLSQILKGDSPGSYFKFARVALGGEMQFLDNTLGTGVDYQDVTYSPTSGGTLHIDWSLYLKVQASNGQAISGADVVVNNKDGVNVFTGQTDAEGRTQAILHQYDEINTGDVYYTPHTFTVSKSGYTTETKTITMDSTKEMTVILDGNENEPPIISNVKAFVNQEAKTATITWDTDQSVSSSLEYGLDTNYGSNKDGGTGTSHSVTLTNLASPSTYHFRITAGQNQGIDHTFFLLSTTFQAVTLTKSVDKTQAGSGTILTYTLNYSASATADNVIIIDPIPIGTNNPTNISNGGVFDGSQIIWNLGNLASGATGNVSFQVTIN